MHDALSKITFALSSFLETGQAAFFFRLNNFNKQRRWGGNDCL